MPRDPKKAPTEQGAPPLPAHLLRYFWEYGGKALTLDHHRHTVIKRLLESGGWDAVIWLRANVGDRDLRDFILAHRGAGMSPKRLRFWGLILRLPRDDVDRWVAAQWSNPWHRRTLA